MQQRQLEDGEELVSDEEQLTLMRNGLVFICVPNCKLRAALAFLLLLARQIYHAKGVVQLLPSI